VEPDTIYVDQAYGGMDSDGSASKPYVTVQSAMSAAPSGSMVAIAAGSYPGHIVFPSKPLRVWGRCPALVELPGDPTQVGFASVELSNMGTSSSELHNVAVTGVGFGFALTDVTDILIDHVWLHDTGLPGVSVADSLGTATATVRHSLIENATQLGAVVHGSTLTIEDSVIRDSRPGGVSALGGAVAFLFGQQPATGSVRRSVIRSHRGLGIAVHNSMVTVEDSAVLDISPLEGIDTDGEGIVGLADPGQSARVDVVGTTIMRAHTFGVLLRDADGSVEETTIRDILPPSAEVGGVGIAVVRGAANAQEPRASLRCNLVANSTGFGVLVSDAEVEMSDVWVRDTQPEVDDFGDGIVVFSLGHQAQVSIDRSRIERSTRAGVSNFASRVTIGQSVLECNSFHLNGEALPFGAFELVDDGANQCGCKGTPAPCKVSSANLQAPDAL